ncbi:amidohydrolase family protein [Aestuariivirga litoralis]|uniref:amidohydrolase family protein n=1 Tax=Aestuariivirga litoralis TaxID=2650924 RepID=UPI0018C80F85|nr:amidohydrolase family protein [Aestuariivirga litoralis]MBG1232368.1 amidohydrolase family protein [Aestuariivirga litoralis]
MTKLALDDFSPRPQLVRRETRIERPRFPVIDAHNHLGPDFGGGWDTKPVSQLIDTLDRAGVRCYVDLDGGWGEDILDARLKKFKEPHPDRFICFGSPGWKHWADDGAQFGEKAAKGFRAQVARGAQGLKIWKNFGLHVKDHTGALAKVDDPSLAPLWETAGELGVPVLIHVADPVAFFDPLDATNERWDELHAHPDWQFPSPPFPSFMSIMDAFANLVRRHKQTTFIGAHAACYAENLGWVDTLMDECPNLLIDFSARISELGRQPFTAKKLLTKHKHRVLFGTDSGPSIPMYQTYYRFLETEDEYFDYNPLGPPTQGRWQIYGLALGDEVLKPIYYDNAARLFKLPQ